MYMYFIVPGIDICTWKTSRDGEEISYSIWDFAGQTVYYNTHHVSHVYTSLHSGPKLYIIIFFFFYKDLLYNSYDLI